MNQHVWSVRLLAWRIVGVCPRVSVDSLAGRFRRLSQHDELQAAQGETGVLAAQGWDHCVLCTDTLVRLCRVCVCVCVCVCACVCVCVCA